MNPDDLSVEELRRRVKSTYTNYVRRHRDQREEVDRRMLVAQLDALQQPPPPPPPPQQQRMVGPQADGDGQDNRAVAQVTRYTSHFDRIVNPPSSNVQQIRQLADSFILDNAAEIGDRRIRLNLWFLYPSTRYTTGEMSIADYRGMANSRFHTMIQDWATKQQKYDEDDRWCVHRLEIVII